MKTKTIIKNISPFNNAQEMPVALYAIKKLLSFFLIFGIAAVIGEVVIIGLLYGMGYDPINGVMPADNVAMLLKFYGNIIFFAVTLIYCKRVEKRSIKSVGFNKKGFDYIIGSGLAVLLLAVIVGVCCVTGVFSFNGFNANANAGYLGLLFGGFVIQSLTEEVMCRGFLLPSLNKKTNLPLAIFVSSTAFALPHLGTVLEADTQFAIIGVINLYLVSLVFSLLFMLRSNIYIVSGLHCVWNFIINGVMGLSASGGSSNPDALTSFSVNAENILTGGVYGLEASIVTTVVLAVATIILVKLYRKRGI